MKQTHIAPTSSFYHIWLTVVLMTLTGLLFQCGGSPESTDSRTTETTSPYHRLIQKAYAKKRTGQNAAALALIEKAQKSIAPEDYLKRASLLDDRGSILMRMGQTKEARTAFERGLQLLNNNNKGLSLKAGIKKRLRILDHLATRGINCNEPERRRNDLPTPYFPDVTQYVSHFAELHSTVANCSSETPPFPITMRIITTGDGQLVMAGARGSLAHSPEEKCVVTHLEKRIPSLDLPVFDACFRSFTYPFMIGHSPEAPSTENTDSDGDLGATATIPPENRSRTTMPALDATCARALLSSYKSGQSASAMDVFCPLDVFARLSDAATPSTVHERLIDTFQKDIRNEAMHFKGEDWRVDTIAPGDCEWRNIDNATELAGYWLCRNNRVVVHARDKTRTFDIAVLVNWGKTWYVTHLKQQDAQP